MEAGQTIAGKYRLNRLLGTGGMATVWSATNVFTEREFAVKFMLPQVARTPEAARRFLLEAKISARINHPNIIEVIDVGQAEDGSLFLVMELLTGVSLDMAVRRQQPPMSVHEFLLVMRDVAVALAAAHASGVIHRDLKPTNIFLHKDRDGRVVPKILDFGVSKILEEENNTALTIVGTVLGSPLYMSPEQAMGAAGIDGRTDVFAFGGILFEALTGQRAFDAPNFNALIVAIATKQPKSIDEVSPQLPDMVRSLVRECLVTEKEQRVASFDRVVERLDAMLPGLKESQAELPSPYGSERPSDPDATHALPVMRPRDRAPSLPPPSPIAMDVPTLPSATRAARRAAESALAWVRRAKTSFRGLPPRKQALAAGGVGLAAVSLVVIVSMAASAGGSPRTPAARAAVEGSTVAGNAVVADPPRPRTAANADVPSADDTSGGSGGSSVPVIAVDSLPVAQRNAPARGNGRLSVAAGPGWCSVSIDGVQRGVTPLSGFELPAGTHHVDCVPPSGKAQSASVSVADGTATHYRFLLDQ